MPKTLVHDVPACDNVKPLLREKCRDALALSSANQVEVREGFSFQEERPCR